ncbi:hydrogenase maturation protease [Marinobacterium sedimentorum]|uniref:hydrogenase maturation protease n=1 Tax=Marinobacterium sedimentorum TaxID=2927804 RepID=UPI0020C670DC|nr:hydrogenase maturation protease [Marinobacterium sedimentorum]MCP8690345.1 hydrogenase maturation protease [Marinobacterium sedimentorum]
MTDVILLALGHPDRTDDGFGERLLRRFETDYRRPPGLLSLYAGHLPMSHYERIAGCAWLVLLDAVQTDSPTSDIIVADPLPALDAEPAIAVHQMGAVQLLQLLEVLGDRPARISLVGAGFASLDWGNGLSGALEARLPQASRALAHLLRSGGVTLSPRPPPALQAEVSPCMN